MKIGKQLLGGFSVYTILDYYIKQPRAQYYIWYYNDDQRRVALDMKRVEFVFALEAKNCTYQDF
jgi:hypothetical protein